MKIHAPAKINLVLDVTGKRSDGYHNVKMVMQALDLCDIVTVELAHEGIVITSNSKNVPCDETNIAYKAAVTIMQEAGIHRGVHIDIQKNIPICAGLAGGSTDGAAVLIALNGLLGLNYSDDKLIELAAKFGADVPFCIMQGTALAEGTGTELSRLPGYGEHNVLLVKPDIDVSTPWVYKNLRLDNVVHPDVDKFIQCIARGDYNEGYNYMGNVLETVTVAEYPVIDSIKQKMIECGAEFAMMSGSGPTVFGIFADEATAKNAALKFKNNFKEVIITKTV
ncbi:MAG: 4-(cytidine 5'-diphospho)-2-C-methyl-D-erythritol kinase [Clostridia bacterium]|nr:4-(cytidine 5'-diphospho)-2-C-methyl-D-erythritol kinase [Clostridia bacterium]